MGVIKFERDFSTLFNWDNDESPTTEQEYQNAVKNWTETEMNIVDTLLWQPTTDYTEENVVKTPSLPLHYVLVCTTGGTSGTEEPSYDNVQIGDSVTDGTVTWTVAKLTVSSDVPTVTDRALVDASNIGVNAEEDNSEAWGNAIGGGAVAEDDGRLVTGGTVHAVTSVLASDIATNTEAIEDNTENIATNTANIESSAVKIDIDDKRISNIEKLLQGNLYDYQTDTDSAYTKTVPNGAMPYASLDSVGGRTLVWNQLVDSGATTVSTISGHKYYTLIDGTASIVTSDGSAITIVDDTADMVCDLTLMFGSGNEPSTTADFTAQFPAQYYAYNPGTLLSAGVTEVVSKGKNLAYYGEGVGVPSNTATSNATKRIFPIGKYIAGLTSNNYYNSAYIKSLVVTESSISVTTDHNGYGVGIPFSCSAGIQYTFSVSSANYFAFSWYAEDGTFISFNSFSNVTSGTATAPSGAKQGILFLRPPSINVASIYSNIQLEYGTTATDYVPAKHIPLATYPIPAEVQALEGYGWSAGSVYNYVDFERKVFVKNVGRINVGEITFGGYDASLMTFWTQYAGYNPPMKTVSMQPANIICERYATIKRVDLPNNDNVVYAVDTGYLSFKDTSFNGDLTNFRNAMDGVYLYYELATPIETDISAYLTDDNLIQVGSGGSLTFPNSNGTDYQIPVPSVETYMVDLQSALGE